MTFPEEIDFERPSPLDQLQVAFAMRIARDIVAADGLLDADEIKLLMTVFPDPLMRKCDFLEEDTQLSEAYHRAYVEAVRVLPLALETSQKLALISLFHEACMVDGVLHPAEMRVLRASAETLDLEESVLSEHLMRLDGSRRT